MAWSDAPLTRDRALSVTPRTAWLLTCALGPWVIGGAWWAIGQVRYWREFRPTL